MGTGATYQWQESTDNGVTFTNIASATAATYTTTSLTNNHQIRLVMTSGITGACVTSPTATSNAITYNLNAPTAITTQPANQSACLSGTASFTVAAAGTGTLTYQWQKNGSNITGNVTAVSSTLNLNGIAAGDYVGDYTVIVTGTCGTATSTPAVTLSQNPATSITTQPVLVSQCVGTTANYSVVALGTGILLQPM
jgi:hypothetical protein